MTFCFGFIPLQLLNIDSYCAMSSTTDFTKDELLERIEHQHELILKCETYMERQDEQIQDLKRLVRNLEKLIEIANNELKR